MHILLVLSTLITQAVADEGIKSVSKNATCQQAFDQLSALALTSKQQKNYQKRYQHHIEQIKKITTADNLNSYGMRCYKASRLDEARKLFDWAVILDENHVLANYNLACVLSRLLATVGPCEMNDDWSRAFALLQRSILLDPKRAERARSDSDFDSIRTMIPFRLLVEGTPKTSAETAALYDGVTLWGETPGAALMAEVHFQRTHSTALSGAVTGWMLDGNFVQNSVQGTWRAEGDIIVVDWASYEYNDKDGFHEQPTHPGWTERIRLDKMNHYGHGGWYTTPDWCSA